MRKSPPRLLLTNVKQLELLLTRQTDVELFDGARLEFLVFDEAHTFSGANGAETACLIRRLRSFCGRGAEDSVCVATSATIADPERGKDAGKEFAARFFGVDASSVSLVGEEYEADAWAAERKASGAMPGDPAAHLKAILDAVDAGDSAGAKLQKAFAGMSGEKLPAKGWEEALFDSLAKNEVVYQLADELSHARALDALVKEMGTRLGRSVPEEEILVWLALGAAARKEGRPFLRPVVHAFVRGIGGAEVRFPGGTEKPELLLSASKTSDENAGEARSFCLKVLTCSTCGQHYFEHHVKDFQFTAERTGGGDASGDSHVWPSLDATLGGVRVVLLDKLVSTDEEDDDDPARTAEVFFCRHCGALHPTAKKQCEGGCGTPGELVRLLAVQQKETERQVVALPRCISCGAQGQQRGSTYREPARPVRAVQVADIHVLAQDMIHHAERPRLLVFADNRQDAAFQAGWMVDHARRFRLRALMWERIRERPISVGDLVAHLDEMLDRDDELSRSLLPEVWGQFRKEHEGEKHGLERRYFLRILVLREITTATKQRVGLEPWGRIRIEYSGLDASLPFIQENAAALGLGPEELRDGVFPTQIKAYLFDENGHVRDDVFDVAPLGKLVERYEADLRGYVQSIFAQGWPADDASAVTEEKLTEHVRRTPERLTEVLRTLKRRLEWARRHMDRLEESRKKKGTLDADDAAFYKRCDRLVRRYKGLEKRTRKNAEGYDDTNTFGVLSAEGFLPGYGLDVGTVVGTAIDDRPEAKIREFPLARAPSMALREYVPGNLLYANGGRFVPRRYQLSHLEQPQWFQVDVEALAVTKLDAPPKTASGVAVTAALGAKELPAIPICDVELQHIARISDDEEFRFQLGVSVYGTELGRHEGGREYQWGGRALRLRRGVHVQLVNVGPTRLVSAAPGFPLCLVCGQSRSPFSSEEERKHFQARHLDRCGQEAGQVGFYANIVTDALSLPDCENRDEAYTLLEALRVGACQVLDMELEDLQVLVIGRAGSATVNGILYDPMPGGSGLLEQICARFSEIVEAAISIVDGCPAQCERACIDCLQTFRNAFYLKHLDRKLAVERLREAAGRLAFSHVIAPDLPKTERSPSDRPTNPAEDKLRRLLQRAGFPEPEWQKPIDLGRSFGTTRPDCFYESPDEDYRGICIYLDGLSKGIHGNPERQQKDRQIRTEFENRDYEVREIAATELDEREAMKGHFKWLGERLLGRERARALREDTRWFDEATVKPAGKVLPFRRVMPGEAERYRTCVPLFTLKAAAGAFSEAQAVDVAEWVEPVTTRKLREGMFVAQVVGKSMEPRISDGAYCLFAAPVEGSRQGKIVLVQHRGIQDPETGGSYTVKRYESEKVADGEGGWRHSRVRLVPVNGAFAEIELTEEDEGAVMVLAEVVEVLG